MSNPLHISAPDGVPYVDIVRDFDAPVSAVFRAFSEPDLIRQWLGPDGYEMDIEEYSFVSGGRYRYVHRSPEGGVFAFNGVFHVVRPDEFAIQTFEWDGAPDQVSIESLTFTALDDGRTRLSTHSTYPSQETRDAMVSSGMEHGVSEGYQKLDELVGGR